MSVSIVDPVDASGSFFSTISEPDLSVGEVEWLDPNTTPQYGSHGITSYAAVNGNDGFIYCVGSGGTVLKINPITKTMSTFGAFSNTYHGAAFSDGDIYCVGYEASVLKINIATQSVTTFGTYTGFYYAAVESKNGNIYCIGTSGVVLKINIANQTLSTFGSASGFFFTATLANDGNIYCVGETGHVLKINTANDTVSTFGVIGQYYSAALSKIDGNIYCLGSSGTALRINTTSQTVSTFGVVSSRFYAASSDLYGDVYGAAEGGFVVRINVSNQSVSVFGSLSGRLDSMAMADSGEIHIPSNAGYAFYIKKSYILNDETIKSSTHRKYRSSSINRDDPALGILLSPPSWVDIGSTNKWAVLSQSVSDQSFSKDADWYCGFNIPDSANCISAFGIDGAESAYLYIYDATTSSLLWSKVINLVNTSGDFEGLLTRSVIFDDLPPFMNRKVALSIVTIDTSVGSACGAIVAGKVEVIGRAVAGTALGEVDYSTLEYDSFGNVKYIERPIVPYHTYQVDVAKEKSQAVYRKIQSVRGRNAVFIADIGMEEKLIAFGRAERAPITYDNPTIVSYSIKVRGSA